MLLIFKTTRAVIRAEKALRMSGRTCRIIPVPRSISKECGMGIEIDDECAASIEAVLSEFNYTIYRSNEYEK